MSDLYWLTDEQMERLQPFFPKSHSKPALLHNSVYRRDESVIEFSVTRLHE